LHFFPPCELLGSSSELNNKFKSICLSLWNFHELKVHPYRDLGNVHFVCMAINPSSSSYCAHYNQPKIKFILCAWHLTWIQVHTQYERKKKNGFDMMCRKLNLILLCLFQVHFHMSRNLRILWSILHFSQLESIHAIGINNQVEGSDKLYYFLQ
jgi:hypothetical protein